MLTTILVVSIAALLLTSVLVVLAVRPLARRALVTSARTASVSASAGTALSSGILGAVVGASPLEGDEHLVLHDGQRAYHGPDEAHAKRVAEQLAARGTGPVARFRNGEPTEAE